MAAPDAAPPTPHPNPTTTNTTTNTNTQPNTHPQPAAERRHLAAPPTHAPPSCPCAPPPPNPLQNGATKQRGRVLVPEHVPKVKDFYAKPCWEGHPLPYGDFIDFKKKEAAELEAERKKIVRV